MGQGKALLGLWEPEHVYLKIHKNESVVRELKAASEKWVDSYSEVL